MKSTIQLRQIGLDSVRVYFAPLVGTFKGIRAEWRRVDRQIQRRQAADQTRDVALRSDVALINTESAPNSKPPKQR